MIDVPRSSFRRNTSSASRMLAPADSIYVAP